MSVLQRAIALETGKPDSPFAPPDNPSPPEDLFTDRDYGDTEVQAFREFLFGRSSEELEQLSARMANEGLTSIELDSRLDDVSRDGGSILFEFFRARLVQCSARRVAQLAGPRHTAEGYVMIAWLQKQCGA